MRWEFIIKFGIVINRQSNKYISKASRKRVLKQKWLKGQKKGAMEKTLIRIITRANPSLPHDSHHRSEYNSHRIPQRKLYSKIIKFLPYKVMILSLMFGNGLVKKR